MVRLVRNGVFVYAYDIPPSVVPHVTKALEYTKLVTQPERGKLVFKTVSVAMWRTYENALVFYCGYVPRVAAVLQQFRIPISSYVRQDRPVSVPFSMDRVDVSSLRPEQVKMLHAIVTHDCGQIVSPTGSGKSYMCAQICKLFSTSHIVFCAPTVDTVATLHRYLRDQCGEDVGQVGGGRQYARRITVATYDSVQKVSTIDACDILVVDECHRVAGESYARTFADISSPIKRFGLTATPSGRSDKAEWLIEGLFGPVIVSISYQESVHTGSIVPVHVIVRPQVHGPSAESLEACRTQACRDRYAIWLNRQRNEQIVADVEYARRVLGEPQTLILVDKVEHLIALHQLLPEYECAFGNVQEEQLRRLMKNHIITDAQCDFYMQQNRHVTRERFESGEARRIIATSVFATGVSSNACQIVALASGTGSTISFIQGLGRGSRTANGKPFSVCLLWKDMFHRAYYRRSCRLIQEAQKHYHVHDAEQREDMFAWMPKL